MKENSQNNLLSGKLGVVTIAMMSVVGIFSLRTLPLMAEYGFSAIFYYIAIALLFFIPSALTCAELATGWPKTGGLYVWVKEAFGSRIGFLAIWLEWTNTVISFPVTLVFIAAMIAYAFNPALADNKYYMLISMLILFWGTTFINFLGIKFSSLISNIGLIFGTLFPCVLMIGLSASWLLLDKTPQIHFSLHSFIPDFGLTKSAFIVGLILGYAGMQVAGFHAQDAKNPQRDYPRAMFAAVFVILALSIFGSLAISIVVPQQKISVVTGIMQAIDIFFQTFHLGWFLPIATILIAIGTFSMVNIWIISPCKGLLASARCGDLPKVMTRVNKYGAPTTLLITQALVGTFFSLVYLLMPTVSSSYWMLFALTALLTLLMNILLFSSVIYLR